MNPIKPTYPQLPLPSRVLHLWPIFLLTLHPIPMHESLSPHYSLRYRHFPFDFNCTPQPHPTMHDKYIYLLEPATTSTPTWIILHFKYSNNTIVYAVFIKHFSYWLHFHVNIFTSRCKETKPSRRTKQDFNSTFHKPDLDCFVGSPPKISF